MKLAYYIKKDELKSDPEVRRLLDSLTRIGCEIRAVNLGSEPEKDERMLLAIGGDGTFLSASRLAAKHGLPLLGVNFGRLGFLSENTVDDVVSALRDNEFDIEERLMLQVENPIQGCGWAYALNEVSVSRVRPSMLGVDVRIDGAQLPTFWADGILVSTSSGSTAYSLSVGGPVCTPDAQVLIVAPIAPHNLNLRPMVVDQDTRVELSLRPGDEKAVLSIDNISYPFPAGESVVISQAPFRLKVVRLGRSSFFKALGERLMWGRDIRNGGK